MTRSQKWKQRTCQDCGQVAPLEAAHIRGFDRQTVVLSALGYDGRSPLVAIEDLEAAEAKIIAAHKPINRVFRFLCADCHFAYDA